MAEKIVCLNDDSKAILLADIESSDLKPQIKNAILGSLEGMEPCDGDIPIDFEPYTPDNSPPTGGKGGGKPKRKLSSYQKHIRDCMRSKGISSFGEAPDAMRECVEEWRRNKEAIKKRYEGEEEDGRGPV